TAARTPVLWHFPVSHFNEKARWALDWKRVPHVREVLALGYMARAWRASGQVRLPILQLDGKTIADSTRIIAALEARFPDPPLYPADLVERERALRLEEFFDEELGPHLRRRGLCQWIPPASSPMALRTSRCQRRAHRS